MRTGVSQIGNECEIIDLTVLFLFGWVTAKADNGVGNRRLIS